jgi:MYXO-CTERM domain-containing protein
VIATDPPVETVVKTCVSPFAVNGTTEIGIKGGTTSTTDLTPLTPNDATATGTSRDTTTGTGPGTTTLPPAGTESADAPSGGCQVGQGSAGTVWGLSLLGLVGLVARRRRRG